jgi:hypothetical protein
MTDSNPRNPVPAVDDDARRRRGRGMLLLVFGVFFGTMLVAGVLRFSGWHPPINRNKGELLQPPVDLRARAPRLAGGGTYAWNPGERTWRILVATPAGCSAACDAAAHDVDVVRKMLGGNADRVEVLWLCAEDACAVPAPLRGAVGVHALAPDPGLRAALAGAAAGGGTPVYVIDPNGFVILRYAPGTDLAGLREDLSRLLKLI